MIKVPQDFEITSFIQVFLIALYFSLFAYASNVGQVVLGEFFFISLIVVLIAIFLFFISSLFFKSFQKGSIFTTFMVLAFFLLVPISEIITRIEIGSIRVLRARYLLLTCIILGLYFCIKLYNSSSHKYFLASCFALPFSILVVYNLILIFVRQKDIFIELSHCKAFYDLNDADKKLSFRYIPDRLPHVFYIILDKYAGVESLKESFNYDNSTFVKALEARGFFIPDNSYSNYPETRYSIPSSLNMTFFPEVKNEFSSWGVTTNLMGNNVVNLLKKVGYKSFIVASDWGPLRNIDTFDGIFKYGLIGDFSGAGILEKSILNFGGEATESLWMKFWDSRVRNTIYYQLKKIKELSERSDPCFVFAHILCPHEPYVFSKNGDPIKSSYVDPDEGYIDQIQYINKEILKIVDYIKKSSNHPIIILQGDHGFGPQKKLKWGFEILNAYLLPYGGEKVFYDSITPVNTFKSLFNYYFGTNMKLLPDKSFLAKADGSFQEVYPSKGN
ncbi:hypothetical protein KAW80_02905 [Candidatus Babeliales bacterium]|nr:hypothetical protein [Candidatus Babeliales bacterium]